MQLVIAKNKKIGDKKAFEVIKNQILKKPSSLIGLASGKTTDGLYKLISKDVSNHPKRWKNVKVFQIDEKLGVYFNSKDSFNFEIRNELKSLFKIIDPKNIFLMDGTQNPKKTIKNAYKFIKKNKGIDLIILGLGPEYDPHIAYNTSGKSSLDSRMRVVKLHPKVGACRSKPIQRITKGITLGIKDILGAKKVLLIAYGKEKAKSIKLAFGEKVNTKRASASALQLHRNLTVVVDKNAALNLKNI